MTKDELAKLLNDTYGINPWPSQYEVDPITYANVVQSYFDIFDVPGFKCLKMIHISLGPNNGVMFKNVELILKR